MSVLIPDAVTLAVTKWREELERASGRDALINFTDHAEETLDLGHAHPNGLAQFLAGRSARLSNLFREPSRLSDARRHARNIRLAAEQLTERHGVRAAQLVTGIARWRGINRSTGQYIDINAPILLHPITIRPHHPDQLDEELQLVGTPRVNTALIFLLEQSGCNVSGEQLQNMAVGVHGFNPRPTFQQLRARADAIPGFTVIDRTVVGIFFDVVPGLVHELQAIAPTVTQHPVLRRLADREVARHTGADLVTRNVHVGIADEVDPLPLDEHVLPLDTDQLAALSLACSGKDIRVSAPAGTGSTQLAAQLLATMASCGQRVLVLCGRQRDVTDVQQRLRSVGLSHVLHDVGNQDPISVHEGLWSSVAADRPGEDSAASLFNELADQRIGLHLNIDPWGVSVSEAIDALTVLTQGNSAACTTVRLPAAALRELVGAQRDATRQQLIDLARQGGFEGAVLRSPWWSASLTTPDVAREALAAARRLADGSLLKCIASMDSMSRSAGLTAPTTLSAGARQMALLQKVEKSLAQFSAEIYRQPMDLLLGATGDAAWRAEHGLKMSLTERHKWRRVAKSLRHNDQHQLSLHQSLKLVAQELDEWRGLSTSGGWPHVPDGLAAAQQSYERVLADLVVLDDVLRSTPGGSDLQNVRVAELIRRVEALAADEVASVVPQRVTAHSALATHGLGPLMADLADRQVPADQVGAEFDLCWWASVFDVLQDQAVLPIPGENLMDLYRTERSAGMARHSERLRNHLRQHAPRQCVAVTGMRLQELRGMQDFDAVVVLSAHACAVPESVVAIAKGKQVVVIGDPDGVVPRGIDEAVESAEPREPFWDVCGDVLPTVELTRQHRIPMQLTEVLTRPATWAAAAPTHELSLRFVAPWQHRNRLDLRDGQSTSVEVDAIISALLQHIANTPEQSLAIIALTRQHARRVADEIREKAYEHVALREWLMRPMVEPFIVTDMWRCEDLVRDSVIVSVGISASDATPLASAVEPFLRPYSERAVSAAFSRARGSLQAVSCVDCDELAPLGSTAPGVRALVKVLSTLSREPSIGPVPPTDGLSPLVAEFASRLGRSGFDVLPTGGAHGWPDLAVIRPGGHPVAVLTDGRWPGKSTYVLGAQTAGALVDDDVALMEHWDRFGWRALSLSSLDLFADMSAAVSAVTTAWAGHDR